MPQLDSGASQDSMSFLLGAGPLLRLLLNDIEAARDHSVAGIAGMAAIALEEHESMLA